MKQIITAVISLLFTATLTAQIIPLELREYKSMRGVHSADLKPGKELSALEVPYGDDALRMYMQFTVTDYKKLAVNKGLHLIVAAKDRSNGPNFFDWYWKPLEKNAPIYTDCAFPAGEYTISLVDYENPGKVFSKREITIKPNEAKVANAAAGEFRYDRSHFKIWTCASVDEKTWTPIGQTSKIKAGSCITLFFDSKDKLKHEGSMRWAIYKVLADGTESVVSQKDQGISLSLEKWSKLYNEECNEFTTKGHYRIYIATKYDSDTHRNVNGDHYFAKADLEVE